MFRYNGQMKDFNFSQKIEIKNENNKNISYNDFILNKSIKKKLTVL